jgi:hypothetical protein
MRTTPRNEWRRRTIIIPSDVRDHLYPWHSGTDSLVYALVMTSVTHRPVSLSMIDAAIGELMIDLKRAEAKHHLGNVRDISRVITELEAIRSLPRMYEIFDITDYGLSAKKEASLHLRPPGSRRVKSTTARRRA